MAGLDPLLHRPRAMDVVLQKFFVVIGFDDERMHVTQSFDDHLGGVTEIGDEAESARAGIKREADGIDCVMRHRERLHHDVVNFALGAGTKDPPVRMLIQRTTGANRFGGLRVGVNRNFQFPAKHFEAANVVAMFMGKKNAVELLGCYAALFEAEHDLPCAQSPIDQNFAMIGCDERAVSRTAAPEHRQTEHAGI